MADVQNLTDSTYEDALRTEQPVMVLFYSDDLRGDFSTAFNKAATEHTDMLFAKMAIANNPAAVAAYGVGSKSVLFAMYQGETLAKRSKPWGSDVPLAIEMVQKAVSERTPQPVVAQAVDQKELTNVDTKPVNVTDSNFQEEVIDHDLPVLVDFWAEWCGPCRMVGPILDKLAEEFAGKVRIAKVNVDENPGLSQYFKVMSIPTLMMFKEQTIVFNQPGALQEPAMRDLIQQLVDLELPPRDEAAEGEEATSEEPAN
jgi:thioredoxin 1